ncbi:hypothetical protein CR513_37728, partial [Mucuna pruriens]
MEYGKGDFCTTLWYRIEVVVEKLREDSTISHHNPYDKSLRPKLEFVFNKLTNNIQTSLPSNRRISSKEGLRVEHLIVQGKRSYIALWRTKDMQSTCLLSSRDRTTTTGNKE